MKGKVCIVTGANSGVGRETAVGLAKMGATVVMACRNEDKSRPVLDDVRRRSGNGGVELRIVDLASIESVHKFAERFRADYGRLDVMVNNAGLYKKDRILTRDGLETQFQTNHLGPFLLTNLLLDLARKSAPARIVNVSSAGHWLALLSFGNLQGERFWNGWLQYCNTKLENVLFTLELSKRLAGTGVTANSLHPGPVDTGFAGGEMPDFAWKASRRFMISAEDGAKTSLYLAASPAAEGASGKYFRKSRVARESPAARNAATAAKLWEVSERLAGLRSTQAA